MRLIDADAMINDVAKFYDEAEHLETFDMVNKICDHIHNAPTIDAVSVVRCQDCKYWVYNFNGCARNPCTEPWYALDFCNYGERRE